MSIRLTFLQIHRGLIIRLSLPQKVRQCKPGSLRVEATNTLSLIYGYVIPRAIRYMALAPCAGLTVSQNFIA